MPRSHIAGFVFLPLGAPGWLQIATYPGLQEEETQEHSQTNKPHTQARIKLIIQI